jgi:heme oxygenase (biliverdin-producing, ferredoxin)
MTETESLSMELREATADVHRQAESSAFVERFTGGTVDRAIHSRHLRALHPVYAALEDGLTRHRDDTRIGTFFLPQLWRKGALEEDLRYLLGDDWRRHPPVPAAVRYAGHLTALTTGTPLLLVSHAYVRYLGDLSGGQMLRRLAAQNLGLEQDGLHFYDFPEIASAGAFKNDFRRRLDNLTLDDGERRLVVDEAGEAFRLNSAIFAQLVAEEGS